MNLPKFPHSAMFVDVTFTSPVSTIRIVNLFELLIHPSYNIDN